MRGLVYPISSPRGRRSCTLLVTFDLDPDPLKHPNSLMIRPANPPPLLVSLSSPNLPPSTSVYTTGITLSPPLHRESSSRQPPNRQSRRRIIITSSYCKGRIQSG
ncbi:unnamed protein product [Brassica rapa subsp. narinosa]